MSTTDELLRNAEAYAASFDKGELPLPPAKGVAVVACMDARLIPTRVLGLEEGDAHVIRNAGGVVTEDEIRSLSISQRLLGTRGDHHHPPHRLRHAHVHRRRVPRPTARGHRHQARPGRRSPSPTSTTTCDSSIGRIKGSPFIPHRDSVRGFVYGVETGRLREVDAGPAQSRFRREPAEDRVTS